MGKRTKGRIEVTGIGIGSKIHHSPIHRVKPAVRAAEEVKPTDRSEKYRSPPSKGASNIR